MDNKKIDYLGEYMAECPNCHHRYNKNMHGNKCPDCGYRNSKTLKILPFLLVIFFIALIFIYPKIDIFISKITNSSKVKVLETNISLLNPVYALIGVNIILFIFGWNSSNAEKYGNSYDKTIRRKQYYRLITSGFSHADILHILCNMWSLYNLGTFVYAKIGIWLFLLFYFITLIIGGLFSIVLHHKNGDDETYSIGASGVICGLLGFYMFFISKLGLEPAILMEAFYKALAPMFVTLFNPGIDHIGHICGLALGLIFSLFLINNMNMVTTINTSSTQSEVQTSLVFENTIEACYVEISSDGLISSTFYIDSVESLNNALNEYAAYYEEKIKTNPVLYGANGTINERYIQEIKYSDNINISDSIEVLDSEKLFELLINKEIQVDILIECDVTKDNEHYKYTFINDQLIVD